MDSDPFSRSTFTAPADRCEFISQLVLKHAPADREIRILDVGCGTGSLLFHLAGRLASARLTGVDISEPNIDAALRRRDELRWNDRVGLLRSDYMAMERGSYDVIVSDSTLQYVQADTKPLFRALEADLQPGGVLLINMPYACPYNSLLWLVRRLFRAVSGRATDRLVYALGTLLNGHEMSDELLRERVGYMYLLPRRLFSPTLYNEIALGGRLRLLEKLRPPHASLGQPKHELAVFRKEA